jgi:hypothetical protein
VERSQDLKSDMTQKQGLLSRIKRVEYPTIATACCCASQPAVKLSHFHESSDQYGQQGTATARRRGFFALLTAGSDPTTQM